jgi:hypothetical protein
MFCDNPASADATRKTTIAMRYMGFRPYRSEILPHNGVDAVEVTRYAVTTQDRWLRPPSSPTMVGSAVDTIVWSSAARRRPSISPDRPP